MYRNASTAGESGFPTGWKMLALMVLICGCHDAEHEEAEHHVPAHKPAEFSLAVERIAALDLEVRSHNRRPDDQIDVFAELYDVARWLPELAADSDLAEEPWNRVQQVSLRLEQILAEVRTRSDDKWRAYVEIEPELKQLHRELLEVRMIFERGDRPTADDHSGRSNE
jgi:hypothetical protein